MCALCDLDAKLQAELQAMRRADKLRSEYSPGPWPPTRDWSAVTDDYEPGHPIGWGASEPEAIADLCEQIADQMVASTTANAPITREDKPPLVDCASAMHCPNPWCVHQGICLRDLFAKMEDDDPALEDLFAEMNPWDCPRDKWTWWPV